MHILILSFIFPVFATTPERDVAVVVDTSGSMRARNMDHDRASLLVTRLLSDIVPGRLAVIRLLDLERDKEALPRTRTSQRRPCTENPSQICEIVNPSSPGGWGALILAARGPLLNQFGVLVRGSDVPGFKRRLDPHLEQNAGNSLFGLAFRAAQAFFTDIGSTSSTVLWLSDGKPEDTTELITSIGELTHNGSDVDALIFGAGNREIPNQIGIPTYTVTDPPTIMAAFSAAFRRIVGAPYDASGSVNEHPQFTMLRHISEAWIVVYGDTTLTAAQVEGPSGTEEADDGADSVTVAGSYRVAHLLTPTSGEWTIKATGGGPNVSYAVIQRVHSQLVSLGPTETSTGIETPLVVALEGATGGILNEPDLIQGLTVTGEVGGHLVTLHDDGQNGDEISGDGKFSTTYQFPEPGEIPIHFRAKNTVLDQVASIIMKVRQGFIYHGPPLRIDLGTTTEAATVCQPLILPSPIAGTTPLILRLTQPLPDDHYLELRANGAASQGDLPLQVNGTTSLQICLVTGPNAPSSSVGGEHLADIQVPGQENDATVPVELLWQVNGVPWYLRWLPQILGALGLLLACCIAYGFIWPFRFPPGTGILLMERPDIEDPPFYAFRNFQTVRIGWYRHMEAYLFDSFRIEGRKLGGNSGASVRFRANGQRLMVQGWKGTRVVWQDADGEWQFLGDQEQTGIFGRLYRIEGKNIYFELRRGT